MQNITQSYAKDVQFDVIISGAHIISHKQALLTLAQTAAKHIKLPQEQLLQHIIKREENGNSSIGDGIVIPQLKIPYINQSFTMLMTLNKDIEHKTPDGTPVNLYAFVVSPVKDGSLHLRRLSRITRLLKNESLRRRILETHDSNVIQSLLMDPEGWLMAA